MVANCQKVQEEEKRLLTLAFVILLTSWHGFGSPHAYRGGKATLKQYA